MSALQIWLENHNRRLTQEAIDEALLEYITYVEKQRDELEEALQSIGRAVDAMYTVGDFKALKTIGEILANVKESK